MCDAKGLLINNMNKEIIEKHMKMHLKDIAEKLKKEIPEGWGFIFLTYPHGEGNDSLLYVSNSQREDVVKLWKN